MKVIILLSVMSTALAVSIGGQASIYAGVSGNGALNGIFSGASNILGGAAKDTIAVIGGVAKAVNKTIELVKADAIKTANAISNTLNNGAQHSGSVSVNGSVGVKTVDTETGAGAGTGVGVGGGVGTGSGSSNANNTGAGTGGVGVGVGTGSGSSNANNTGAGTGGVGVGVGTGSGASNANNTGTGTGGVGVGVGTGSGASNANNTGAGTGGVGGGDGGGGAGSEASTEASSGITTGTVSVANTLASNGSTTVAGNGINNGSVNGIGPANVAANLNSSVAVITPALNASSGSVNGTSGNIISGIGSTIENAAGLFVNLSKQALSEDIALKKASLDLILRLTASLITQGKNVTTELADKIVKAFKDVRDLATQKLNERLNEINILKEKGEQVGQELINEVNEIIVDNSKALVSEANYLIEFSKKADNKTKGYIISLLNELKPILDEQLKSVVAASLNASGNAKTQLEIQKDNINKALSDIGTIVSIDVSLSGSASAGSSSGTSISGNKSFSFGF